MTTNNQSTFQNENLQVIVKKEPGCKILLDVIVTSQATQASYQKAIANIRKSVSFPGFRKGKVPEALILQNYEKQIESEWKDILLNTTLHEAIELIKIFPFNRNSVKVASVKSASKQEGSTLSFEYEASPDVPVITPETLSIPAVAQKTITEKDVDDSIEDLTLQNAEWSNITDRPANEGDFVLVDIDDIGEQPKNICKNSPFSLKKGKMGEWMRKLIVGMKPGESIEGMSESEEHDCKACKEGTHDHTHSDFVPTFCRITLNTIRHAKPHALDDDLAKKYGAKNYQELLERVKTSLKKRASDEQKDQQRHLMEHALLKNYPFDMPASLVQGELKAVRKKIFDSLRAEGVEESEISTKAKKIEEETAEKYDRDFRLYFLTQTYARKQNIQVNQEEITVELMRQTWLKQLGQNTIDTNMDPKEIQSQLELQLLAVKTIDQMIEKAQKLPEKA